MHEMIFYMLFSVWFYSKRLFHVLIFAWVSGILYLHFFVGDQERFTSYFLSPLNLNFVLGIGIYLVATISRISTVVACTATILGTGLVIMESSQVRPDRFWVAIGFGFIVLASASSLAGAFKPWRWLLYLGGASYSIYLIHNPVQSAVVRVVARIPAIEPHFAFMSVAVISLAAGVVYSQWYEKPALAVLKAPLKRS